MIDKLTKKNNYYNLIIELLIRNNLNEIAGLDKKNKVTFFFKEIVNKIDIDFLFFLIKKNKLIPFLKDNNFIKDIIPKLHIKLIKESKVEFLKSLRLSYLTSEISSYLESNSIKYIVIKGIPLSIDIYNDFYKRGAGDLDILVDQSQIFDVINLLKKKNFFCSKNNFPIKKNSISFKYSKWVYYEITLTRIHKNYIEYIDLHWRINNNTGGIPNFSEIWNSKKSINLNNKKINIPNFKHNLIIIAANLSKDRWSSYRNLVDLQLLIRKKRHKIIDKLIKHKFFFMSLYRLSKLTKDNYYRPNLKYIVREKITNFIIKENYKLTNKKYLKKEKLKYRMILFIYKLYLCENINDLFANLCINIITPNSLINSRSGELNNIFDIVSARMKSFKNLL